MDSLDNQSVLNFCIHKLISEVSRTDWFGQTMQTQIETSDQDRHCLPFHLHQKKYHTNAKPLNLNIKLFTGV